MRRLNIAIGPIVEEFGGVSQHILAIQKYSSHRISPIPPRLVRVMLRQYAGMYMDLIKRVGLHGYDIVHSHVDPSFVNLCLNSRTTNCRWVHTYHLLYFDEDYPEGLASWQKEINRELIETASKADIRISVAKWLRDYLQDVYSIQTEYIPNGVDLAACDKANRDRFVKRYGLDNFVLFVGGLQPVKNPQLFLKLVVRIPDVKFVMIGRNMDPIRIMKDFGLSIPSNLTLMGEMRHADLLDATSACKAFVMTTKREGLPTALLEAMAMCKPVVVPNINGCKEIADNVDNCFSYTPNSLDDLAEQTKRALISTSTGKKAREKVASEYDWKVVSKQIDSLYEGAISRTSIVY